MLCSIKQTSLPASDLLAFSLSCEVYREYAKYGIMQITFAAPARLSALHIKYNSMILSLTFGMLMD